MARTTISSRGQTVIPKSVREYLHIGPGDQVDFVIAEGGAVYVRPATRDISRLAGMLRRKGAKPLSIEDMDEAIRKGALHK